MNVMNMNSMKVNGILIICESHFLFIIFNVIVLSR